VSGIGTTAAKDPERTALVIYGTAVAFGELDHRQRLLVGALKSAGVMEKDRIAVLSTNRREVLEIVIGTLRAGIVPVPINALLTAPEVAYILEDSGARWLFTDHPIESHHGLDRIVTLGDAYERLLSEAKPTALADFVRGRPMHYTSGTTGQPKGVWVRPSGVKRAAQLSAAFRRLWEIEAGDMHLICSPLAHSAPLRFSTRTLEAGGKVVLQDRFDAEETLATIALFGVTSAFMVPTHLERILALGRKTLARYDLSSIRLLAHAGAPIREGTKRNVIELFPEGSVWEFYGSTEGQATRISATEWLEKPGSVGKALEGAEILIRDSGGNALPDGEIGEVWVNDPRAERFEYWRDKRKTQSAWREGAFTVGDLGWLDRDGYLFLTGRKHATIITGGVNVYPQEVEQVLLQHPAVKEALVYGVEHDEWGQVVHASVVPEANSPLDGELLRTWARERLAGFKLPRKIEVVKELERTPTGKIKRRGQATK
jgi:acyl-CoA synthetase (AMP-forming)/AMP-acid ligase II